MNVLERRMIGVLKDLRENHHVAGVKAEFEAEGTRLEEALRLKDVLSAAGLGLTIKIGGCEALRDLYEARTIGVERIVAPMVESAYALKKYLAAVSLAYPKEEQDSVQFAINVETALSVKNLEQMLGLDNIGRLGCVVVGRVDLSGSLGIARDQINCDQVFEIVKKIVTKSKAKGIETTIGGGIAAEALPFLRALPAGSLDRYETRKVIFKCPQALDDLAPQGILKAVGFELLWLKNKRDYYHLIAEEDAQRLTMLEARYKKMIENTGVRVE